MYKMRNIYFDHNATTTMCEDAWLAQEAICQLPLNASSVHRDGRMAKSMLDEARDSIYQLTAIKNKGQYNLIFTSSGTEANNLIMNNYLDGQIFISAIEHPSILEFSNHYENIKIIKVLENGIIDRLHLEKLLRDSNDGKKLVSIMIANNETGIIQPIKEIAEICKRYNAHMHSDLVQAPGKMEFDIEQLEIEYATISGHKFGSGLGAGALISKATNYVRPSIFGGGQEKGARSGTENASAISAMSAAAKRLMVNYDNYLAITKNIRDYFEQKISQYFKNIILVGQNSARLINTSMLIFKNKKSELVVIALDLAGFSVSSGSACSSGKVKKSHVLSAMGYNDEMASSAIRVSFNHTNTFEEVDKFIDILKII